MALTTYGELGSGVQKGTATIREDLLDFIENLSPADTPLYNNLGQIKVNAGFVEYLEDVLASRAANAWVEGAAATDPTLSSPSRNASIVQIMRKHIWVSGRQQAVNHAGMASAMAYQELKKAKEIKNDIELALHRGSAVSGTTSAAPTFGGMLNVLSTNFTAASGLTLSETVFNDIVTLTYAYPSRLREVYCNMNLKRTINGFSTNVTRQIQANDKRQVNVIDVYDSEIGPLAIFKSRDQLQGTITNSWIAIDPDYFQVGWLRPLSTVDLPRNGDSEGRMIIGECTLIVKSEKAGAGGTGFADTV
jgi:hypothetical protein